MSDSRDTACAAARYTLRSRAAKARSWIDSSTCRSPGASASVVGEPSTGAASVDRTCEWTAKCGGLRTAPEEKPAMSMKHIEANGARIAFHDAGSGVPVLLLHGFPLTSESFQPQLDGLAARFRLIVPDHRGFGQSGPAGAVTEMSQIAQDALAVLD